MMRSVVVAMALMAAPASAVTLVDGGFEIQGAALPVANYCYNGVAAGGNPACAPGAWGPNGGVIRTGNAAWGGKTTPAGTFFGFIQGRSVVSQSFTADQNATGVVSWIDTNRTNQGGLQSYDVSIFDGTTSTLIGNYTSATGGWVARSSSSFALVNGTTYTLRFTGLTSYVGTANSDRTSFIDSIALATTPVPESATWVMLLAGFGLVGVSARRRRTAGIA